MGERPVPVEKAGVEGTVPGQPRRGGCCRPQHDAEAQCSGRQPEQEVGATAWLTVVHSPMGAGPVLAAPAAR